MWHNVFKIPKASFRVIRPCRIASFWFALAFVCHQVEYYARSLMRLDTYAYQVVLRCTRSTINPPSPKLPRLSTNHLSVFLEANTTAENSLYKPATIKEESIRVAGSRTEFVSLNREES